MKFIVKLLSGLFSSSSGIAGTQCIQKIAACKALTCSAFRPESVRLFTSFMGMRSVQSVCLSSLIYAYIPQPSIRGQGYMTRKRALRSFISTYALASTFRVRISPAAGAFLNSFHFYNTKAADARIRPVRSLKHDKKTSNVVRTDAGIKLTAEAFTLCKSLLLSYPILLSGNAIQKQIIL